MEVTLVEYWDMLNAHDWYHSMSDDRSVEIRGAMNESRLISLAIKPEYWHLYIKFEEHFWSGPPWGPIRLPKPDRPK